MTRCIGILGFDGITALDLSGPAEVFATANYVAPSPAYEVMILGLTAKPFLPESGMKMLPHITLAAAPALDTIIVPGGAG
ncbi:MAG: GlxA family transcriptional regulator, partial [Alphaproteobacteria bacterium]|nr:GlxA family transcriptional regulator [Alphaproteobacteria bacterium]